MKQIFFESIPDMVKSVIKGRVTQTRRVVFLSMVTDMSDKVTLGTDKKGRCILQKNNESSIYTKYTKFDIGDTLAVGQSYKTCYEEVLETVKDKALKESLREFTSFISKDSVPSESARHHLRIRNIRLERMQDISEKDCLASGIHPVFKDSDDGDVCCGYTHSQASFVKPYQVYATPLEAYKALVCIKYGQDMWQRNSYVVVYDFELID